MSVNSEHDCRSVLLSLSYLMCCTPTQCWLLSTELQLMGGRHTLGCGYDVGANRILELAESLKHDNIPLL